MRRTRQLRVDCLRSTHGDDISVEHNWILALTDDIHSCSHVTASNMKPIWLILEQQSMCVPIANWYGFSPLSLSTKQLSLKSAGGDVLRVTCIEISNFK